MTDVTENQGKLIENIDGIHIVDAGPGTGKTETIVNRYVSMLKNGISPKSILMLTFTDNAAMEMEERIKGALRKDGDPELVALSKDVLTMTFDSFCHAIVAENAQRVNRPFGTKHKLTSAAVISTNESLNRKPHLAGTCFRTVSRCLSCVRRICQHQSLCHYQHQQHYHHWS